MKLFASFCGFYEKRGRRKRKREIVMTYEEAVAYMEEASTFGINLELETTQELLKRLNDPQKKLKYIHIAGTNGKGSVAAYLAHILACQGYKVGRYISPAVFDFCERIEITQKKNGRVTTEFIHPAAVAKLTGQLRKQVEQMTADGCCPPTCFELQTVLAFLEFERQQCDLVLLEVGLGGRYDSTNVISDCLCSVITSISYDHCAVLGDTIAKIAYEKAGIIKKNSTVVVYDQEVEPEQSLPVLEKTAKEMSCEYIVCDFSRITDVTYSLRGTSFSYKEFRNIGITLLGKNQVKNAVLALETVQALRKKGIVIADEPIREGLRMTRWRGRFDLVSEEPLMIADGAHNADAAKALEESIQLYLSDRPVTFVMGVFKDKDYRGILRHTAKYAKRIILLTTAGERSLSKEELSAAVREYTTAPVYEADSVRQALFLAKSMVEPQGAILTFGSLSFLGEIYRAAGGIGRAALILENEIFRSCLKRIGELEKERRYCRHDLSHLLDVARLMCLMTRQQQISVSAEYCYAAALLHDLGRAGEYEEGIGHEQAGALLAEQILQQCFFSEREIRRISGAILEHRHALPQEADRTEAGQAEVGQTEAGQTEAGQTEVGQMEAGQAEADQTEAGQAEEWEAQKLLSTWLKKADHRSRNCFICEEWDSCKWSEERKNRDICW